MRGHDLLKMRKAVLRLNFLGPTMDNMVNFTRATAANYFGSNGLLQSAASGRPRFDYDPVALTPLGLFMEEARTNLCLRNSAWTNAAWTRTSCNATANSQTGVDGTLSYGSLTASAGNGTCLQAITVVNGTTYTFSVDLKRLVGTGNIQLTMDGGATWTTVAVTGTLTRFSITATSTSTSMTVGVRIVTNADSVVAGGAQLEQGLFATSRLTTAASSTSRNRDQASIVLPAPFLGANSDVAFQIEWQPISFVASMRVAGISDGTTSNEILLGTDASGNLTMTYVVNGNTLTITGPQLAAGVTCKIAVSVGQGGLLMAVNGVIYLASGATVIRPLAAQYSSFDLGLSSAGGALYMRGCRVWRNALTREHLSAVTT